MNTIDPELVQAVRRSITVKSSLERAFQVFTAEYDSWWPRTHHIGKAPMTRAIIECRKGGRCYTEHEDGSETDFGTILVWDPPHRFVMAWQITDQWSYEPDLSKSSEVEIHFTPTGDGSTRVDLEHRGFERHGAGGSSIREAVGKPDAGWGGVLQEFAKRVEKP